MNRRSFIVLIEAVKTARRLKDKPLPICKHGNRDFYDFSEDHEFFLYNASMGIIEGHPRIARVLKWLKIV